MITLPWPPTLNTYWRNSVVNGRPRTMLSRKAKIYRKTVYGWCLKEGIAAQKLSGRLAVRIDCYPPDKRKRDLDNLPKAVLDALTHAGVWLDDSQIDELVVVRLDVVKGGMIKVLVVELS